MPGRESRNRRESVGGWGPSLGDEGKERPGTPQGSLAASGRDWECREKGFGVRDG